MEAFVRRSTLPRDLTALRPRSEPTADLRTGGGEQSVDERIGVHVGAGEDRVPAGPSGLWGALAGRAGDAPDPLDGAVDPMFPAPSDGAGAHSGRREPARG